MSIRCNECGSYDNTTPGDWDYYLCPECSNQHFQKAEAETRKREQSMARWVQIVAELHAIGLHSQCHHEKAV